MLDYDVNTEIYLRSDISNALNALAETVDDLSAIMPAESVEMFRTGYYAALRGAARRGRSV